MVENTPADAKTKKALIEILDDDAVDESRGLPKRFHVQFNPTQYDISKSVNYEETKTPGLNLPLLKFVNGEMETLSLELFFDTTDRGLGENAKDVRELTRSIYQLSQVQPKTHAPPRIRVTWGGVSFKAVAGDVKQTFTLFNPNGVPLRAKVTVTFKKFLTIEEQEQAINKQSPDRFKVHMVRRGDNLPGIAAAEYDNPAYWKVIADYNVRTIADPRRLAPGTVLALPRIDAFGRIVGT